MLFYTFLIELTNNLAFNNIKETEPVYHPHLPVNFVFKAIWHPT